MTLQAELTGIRCHHQKMILTPTVGLVARLAHHGAIVGCCFSTSFMKRLRHGFRQFGQRVCAVSGPSFIAAVAEHAEIVLIASSADEESTGQRLSTRPAVCGVACPTNKLAVFEWKFFRHLHAFGRLDASAMSMFDPHSQSVITDRAIMAAETHFFLTRNKSAWILDQWMSARLLEIGGPRKMADRTVSARCTSMWLLTVS
jgi:hypothetical protein